MPFSFYYKFIFYSTKSIDFKIFVFQDREYNWKLYLVGKKNWNIPRFKLQFRCLCLYNIHLIHRQTFPPCHLLFCNHFQADDVSISHPFLAFFLSFSRYSFLFHNMILWDHWKIKNQTTDLNVSFCLYCVLLIKYIQLDTV